MLTWFIYDISDDKIRKRLSDKAQELGLYRVQMSVFLGDIDMSSADELAIFSEEKINMANDSVYILPMCQKDFNKIQLIGEAFDKALVNDEIQSLFI